MRARINNQDIYNLSCKLDMLSERIEKEMTHSKQKMENLKVRVAKGFEEDFLYLVPSSGVSLAPYSASVCAEWE